MNIYSVTDSELEARIASLGQSIVPGSDESFDTFEAKYLEAYRAVFDGIARVALVAEWRPRQEAEVSMSRNVLSMKSMLLGILAFITTTTAVLAQAPEPATFALSPADVPKVVIFMYEGGKTWIEVTYNKEKQAEFARLASDNLNKPIKIVLNGKPCGERTLKDANVGHSIKVDMASPEEAFATAKGLLSREH